MIVPDGNLESEAEKVLAAASNKGAADMALAYSIAISLKRLADGIDKLGQPIAEQIVAGLRAPVNSYGEGIGEAIQGQIIRGQRGIDQYEGR